MGILRPNGPSWRYLSAFWWERLSPLYGVWGWGFGVRAVVLAPPARKARNTLDLNPKPCLAGFSFFILTLGVGRSDFRLNHYSSPDLPAPSPGDHVLPCHLEALRRFSDMAKSLLMMMMMMMRRRRRRRRDLACCLSAAQQE